MTWKLKDEALEADLNRLSNGTFSPALQKLSDTAARLGLTGFSVQFGDKKGRGGTSRFCIHLENDEVEGLAERQREIWSQKSEEDYLKIVERIKRENPFSSFWDHCKKKEKPMRYMLKDRELQRKLDEISNGDFSERLQEGVSKIAPVVVFSFGESPYPEKRHRYMVSFRHDEIEKVEEEENVE